MASALPICLMARASSTKSWLWHQRLSHLNFDTINDLARNDLVAGLLKFKYHKEHLCPSCEQGKSKKASHPPKPVSNSRQRLHLFHMDLCGPMRIASINEKQYILVIVDDYSRYTWVHFLRSKDEAPAVIITFLKRITVLLQIYNRRTKKIMETMNVLFYELSTMAFEPCSLKPRLQSMTSGRISSGLDLTYAPRMISEPGDANREVPINETFHEQIYGELTEKELKQVKDDDQSIQTILLGSEIGIQEKKAKLFNEWEMFTSNDGESIESYYHHFSKLMNDFKRNKHFPEKISTGSENRPPMLNKENYVSWSSRLLRYAKSRPNGKLIYNSIINGPYVRRMISEPGDANCEVPINETFHEQTYGELTEKEPKQVKDDDQSIQTILLGLPEDIYAAIDSCETT
nr:retrovirus-related Pol polyprotein from transposon TNT 1-94 [Tanacetum cinerariifolium]